MVGEPRQSIHSVGTTLRIVVDPLAAVIWEAPNHQHPTHHWQLFRKIQTALPRRIPSVVLPPVPVLLQPSPTTPAATIIAIIIIITTTTTITACQTWIERQTTQRPQAARFCMRQFFRVLIRSCSGLCVTMLTALCGTRAPGIRLWQCCGVGQRVPNQAASGVNVRSQAFR